MSADSKKDLLSEAKNFCDGLGNIFMMKRRDPQTQHLLQKAKALIEGLMSEKRSVPSSQGNTARASRSGGMGQLWMKLDELKRENEELRKHSGKQVEDKIGKHQGPGEVIIADLHKTRTENESLKNQLLKAQTTIEEMKVVNASLQDQFKRTKLSHDIGQQTLEKIRREQKNLETSLDSVKTENDHLKRRYTNSVKPMIRTDNRHVENINERCRPSNIAILYNNLESQEWVDAKESLEDTGMGEEDHITKFLADVLLSAYEASGILLESIESSIMNLIKSPTTAISSNTGGDASRRHTGPEDFRLCTKELLRQNVDGMDAGELAQVAKEHLLKNPIWGRSECFLQNKSVNRYVEECSRITWQMVIQHPPMCLSTKDTRFDDERHKLWWSCDRSKTTKIDYFIWPSLYDFENGNLMVKGCVFGS